MTANRSNSDSLKQVAMPQMGGWWQSVAMPQSLGHDKMTYAERLSYLSGAEAGTVQSVLVVPNQGCVKG